MSRWFRFYDATLDDPKVQCLSDKLFRTWVNVLCIASRNNGFLPSVGDMSFLMRLSAKETSSRLGELRTAGLIDDDPETGVAPHNWNGRQFRSDGSTERVKRFRERSEAPKRNVSEAVNGTGPETETETDIPFPNGKGSNHPPPAVASSGHEPPDAELYRRGKEVLGASSGGMIRKLLASKGGNIPLARAALETASTKADRREYIGAIISSRDRGLVATDDLIS